MFKLVFTQDQLTLLARAIEELPHKLAVPLINSINKQLADATDKKKVIKHLPQKDD